MNFEEYLTETAISKGKTVTIMFYNAISNSRRPTDVRIVDYEKKIAGKDMVYFQPKGKPTLKLDINTFRMRMKQAASISI